MERRVDGYVLQELVGTGATGTVYAGYQTELRRQVAIKALSPRLLGDAAFRERFRQEARVMARLDSPDCVRVFDFIENDSGAFLVTEYVDGASLRELLDHSGRLAPEQALHVIRGALRGLAYAHALGLVHRDVKPANVLCDREGHSKLADFGLAVPAGTAAADAGPTGSPLYVSPEQATGSVVDARNDVYSCGALLFELLTGRPPYEAETPVALLARHVSDAVVDPRSVNPELSPGLADVVMTAMAKAPAQRFQSAETFLAALEREAQTAYGAQWQERGALRPLVVATISAGAAAAALAATTVAAGGGGALAAGGATIAGTTVASATTGGVTAGAATGGAAASAAGAGAGGAGAAGAGAGTAAAAGGGATAGTGTAGATTGGGVVSGKTAVIAVATVAVVGAGAAVYAATRPSPPPPTAQEVIAFDGRHGADGGIFVVNPDGAGFRHVAGTALGDVEPSLSPDRKRIAFVRVAAGVTNPAIYVVDTAGGTPIRLTTPPSIGADRDPVWSPDGSQIVYLHSPDFHGVPPTINVMAADGSAQRTVITPPESFPVDYAIHPTWSPDGKWIAFGGETQIHAYIYWVRPDGSGLTHLPASSGPLQSAFSPTWSPDGRRFAFLSEVQGGSTWVVNADGSNPVFLFKTPLGGYGRRAPAWSPDAKHLAVEQDVGNFSHVFVMIPDGSAGRDITPDGDFHDPTWSSAPAESISVPPPPSGSTVTSTPSPSPSPSPPPSLKGEVLFANCGATPPGTQCPPPGVPSVDGSVTVTCTSGPGADATLSFNATGVAIGPYPGTFTEKGAFIVGPPGTGMAGRGSAVVSVSSTFTITSANGTVTGSKSSSGVTQPVNSNFCDAFPSESFADAAAAFATYTATIQTSQGLFADSGATNPQVGKSPRTAATGSFWEPF